MFSEKRNIQQLTSLIVKYGITEAVICPGSRNSAIVHNLKAAKLKCYEITDERSAGFFAIGLMEANGGKPVAVCVTSGSAVLNLAPAVCEAFYRNFPLLVITADRPERWIGQMDGQTMPQPNAFGNMVAKCVSLPEPTDEETAWYCNRLINEALIEQKNTNRPVHINVPITEPMFSFNEACLPDERLISFVGNSNLECEFTDEMKDVWRKAEKAIIIIGQMLPKEMEQCSYYLKVLYGKGSIIIAENLSNIHTVKELNGCYIGNFDEMIARNTFETPELVITLGGHIVSKRLKQFMRNNAPKHHWHISNVGELADLFMCCTDLIYSIPASFLHTLSLLDSGNDSKRKDYQNRMQAESCKTTDIKNSIMNGNLEFCDIKALHTFLPHINADWHIHVANSSMVRSLQSFFCGNNPVHCNRGVNGIEGSSSAAVGYWVASCTPTLLLTGDLSFFYDKNALWNNYVKAPQSPLRILIFNNGCGQIFHHLPGLEHSPYLHESIAASHTTTAEGIALECGAQYLSANNENELISLIPTFMSPSKDVKVLEVFTDSAIDEKEFKQYGYNLINQM